MSRPRRKTVPPPGSRPHAGTEGEGARSPLAPHLELVGAPSDHAAAEHLRVLLVEDDPNDVFLLMDAFSQVPSRQFKLEHVDHLASALRRLEQGGLDMVLLDMGLPDAQGVDAVRRVREAVPQVPIVVLTGLHDERLALGAIQAGAQDYLIKGEMNGTLLLRALRYARERHRIAAALVQKSAELARANEKLQEMNRQKDEFISRVSHELRTPLAAIYQFGTIMSDGLAGETSPEQRQYLDILLRNAREMRSMVGELIEATRAETGKLRIRMRRTPVPHLVEEVVVTEHPIALAKNIALAAEVPRDLPAAHADPQRVRQILINLIDNGIKFTPENGSITVRARVWEEDPRMLCLAVEDTGAGMRPEVQDRVFERLYQDERSAASSRQGLGLGLYICKQLVACHGGRIWAESRPGAGSRFSFTLPLFSLPDLLEPVLRAGDGVVDAATLFLVDVELAPGGRFVSRRSLENAVHECRKAFEAAPPSAGVLLPEMGRIGSNEPVMLVAAVGADDARRVARRLQDEAARVLSELGLEAEPRVACRELELSAPRDAGGTRAILTGIARTIEGALNRPASPAGNGPKEGWCE